MRLNIGLGDIRPGHGNFTLETADDDIQRGTGELAGDRLEEVRYEGYGPSGVAVMVDTLTDNRNRTSAAVRHLFSKGGGNLGETNSVGWMFERKGVMTVNAGKRDPEEVALAAIEAGADDVQVERSSVEITTSPSAFERVKAAVEALGVSVENAEITMQPKQMPWGLFAMFTDLDGNEFGLTSQSLA